MFLLSVATAVAAIAAANGCRSGSSSIGCGRDNGLGIYLNMMKRPMSSRTQRIERKKRKKEMNISYCLRK